MKTILLTGGTGFLGSYLLKELLREKYEVILLKRSFSDVKRIEKHLPHLKAYNLDKIVLENIFSENNIHTIIHCATDYGKNSSGSQVEETNYRFPAHLLELAKKSKCKRFINTDTILLEQNSPYASSKKKFLQLLKTYKDHFLCNNVRTEQFYGPGDDDSKFVSFLILKFLNNDQQIELTLGEQERGFLYIDDLIRAFIKIVKSANELESGFFDYEIGTYEKIKIKHLVQLVKKMTGNSVTHLNFGAIPYRENELMNYMLDTNKIEKLGWKPQISLEQGVKKTIEYFINRK